MAKGLDPLFKIVKRDAEHWARARRAVENGPRVLIATSMGGFHAGLLVEGALAVALTLRGAKVDFLLCDKGLPCCILTKVAAISPQTLIRKRGQSRCPRCYNSGKEVVDALGLDAFWYGRLVSRDEARAARRIANTLPIEEIGASYLPDGLAVGEHALAGALRYYARGDLDSEPNAKKVLRLYLESAHLSVFAMNNLLERNSYDVACFNHGLYVPQGLVVEACRAHGVRIVTWNHAYRKPCFIFSHGDTYHHTMISEPTSEWENIVWTSELESATMDYLKSRWQGTQDWIWFHENPVEDLDRIAKDLGVDFSRPCIGLLTNVMWDAQLHYKSNAFPGMLDWVLQTISYFSRRPDLQLLIRVHPAEVRGFVPSRQPLVPEIQRAFPNLPPNVFVIPPESRLSTYAVAEKCDSVIIFNTKTGIELCGMGIPVVVAGEAWIRGKGFSIDANSPEEYFSILDKLPVRERLNASDLERARKYAFHFFFRRMIPLPFVQSVKDTTFALDMESLSDLDEGKYAGLDVVTEGILRNTPFVYPAECEELAKEPNPC